MAACYFGTALFPCIRGAGVFFGHSTYLGGILLWMGSTAALSLPFALLWSQRCPWRAIGLVVALCIEALLPIGLASPLTCTGIIFPGSGFIGIFLVLLFCATCAFPLDRWHLAALTSIGLLALGCNSLYQSHPTQPFNNWRSVNTHLGGGPDSASLDRVIKISNHIRTTPADVLLLPENAIPEYSDELTGPWLGIQPQETVLIGTTLDIPGTRLKENMLLARGSQTSEYRQRIPVPVAMWGSGYPADFTDPGTITIKGERAAVLLCYEQLLVFPVLSSFLEHPSILLASSNLYWARGTNIGDVERVCVQGWARLFAVPYLRAVNT